MKKDYTRPGKYRERRVDNSIGAHMLRDAYKDVYDIAILLSSDPDFTTNVQMVLVEGKKVELCLPDLKLARELSSIVSVSRTISIAELESCLRPEK